MREKIQAKFQKRMQRAAGSVPGRMLRAVSRVCGRHPFLLRICSLLLCRAGLDIYYYLLLVRIGGDHTGFTASFVLINYLCSWAGFLALLLPVVCLGNSTEPSSILISFLSYLYFIPLTSHFGLDGTVSPVFFAIALVYWALLYLWQIRLPVLRLRPLSAKSINRLMILLTAVCCILVLYVSGRYTHFRFTLNVLDVYGIRNEAKTYSMPGILSYAASMAHLPLILCILYWLRKKRRLLSVLLCTVYIFLFSIGAHKTIFFVLVLALASHFLYRDWMFRWAPGLLGLLGLAAVFEHRVVGTNYTGWVFLRRMLYVPVLISERCYNFFSENPLNLFRNGIMGRFSFDGLYSINMAYLMGEAAGTPDVAANNGLLGDMLTNLPVLLGLLLMPLILVLCFRLLDLGANCTDRRQLIWVCILFANKFADCSWSTTLLTHGFLLVCVLLYISQNKEGSLNESG